MPFHDFEIIVRDEFKGKDREDLILARDNRSKSVIFHLQLATHVQHFSFNFLFPTYTLHLLVSPLAY